MKLLILISTILFNSCATASQWKPIDVSFKDQPWRICTKEIDGPEFHLKGLCYWQKQIKYRRFRSDLTRRVHLHCSWEDKECLLKFAISGKKVK